MVKFMRLFNSLESVGTVQKTIQKHYENDTDELKRYGFFKKSKANVMKLNALNPKNRSLESLPCPTST